MLDCAPPQDETFMKRSRQDSLTFEILEAIDARKDISQRRLADELGVALGLTNSYLRRCVRKGLVKIQQAPANRYLYYLTPQGFAEKSRLAAEYLRASLDYYHRAGISIAASLEGVVAAGGHRIVFAGMSELSEIASIRAHDFAVDIIGTIDSGATTDRFLGRPVWIDVPERDFDAVLFTALANPRDLYFRLLLQFDPNLIHVPAIVAPLLGDAVTRP
jgi:DNA-binding MarR family transcriptional regulator